MATLMCPQCHRLFPPGEIICPEHTEFLVPEAAEPVPDRAGADPSTGDRSPTGPRPTIPPEAAIYRPPARPVGQGGPNVTVRDRPDAPGVEFILEFPWGPVPVGTGETLVGRSPDAGALAAPVAVHGNVSRYHARVYREGDALFVTDLDSTNHTFVNDRELASREPHRLRDGDVVRFGADLSARVRERRR